MQKILTIGPHLSEATLEEYAFGRLLEPGLGSAEEHLLLCETCQESLGEIDEYILLMKAAAAEPASALPPRRRRRAAYIAAGAAAAAVAMALIPAPLGSGRVQPAETVELVSFRGVERAHIHANRPADLQVSLPDLPDGSYRVEMVDSASRLVWSAMAPLTRKKLSVREPKVLKSGVYWIRLYSATGELLREFGLESS